LSGFPASCFDEFIMEDKCDKDVMEIRRSLYEVVMKSPDEKKARSFLSTTEDHSVGLPPSI